MNDTPSPAGPPPEPETPELSEESPTRDSVEIQPPEPGIGQNLPATTGPGRRGWLSRVFQGRARRDQQLQTLQSGYVEMLDMMRSISRHLDRQADAQDQLLRTLDHFPEALQGLSNVGKATEQQIAVLGMVREQLEVNARHEQEIMRSMDGFNKTLNLMDETARNTTATIGELVESSRDAEDELRAMLERSERRLTILTGVLGVFGIVAIAGAITFGFIQSRPAPTPGTVEPLADIQASTPAPGPAAPADAPAPTPAEAEPEPEPADTGTEPAPAVTEPAPADTEPAPVPADATAVEPGAEPRGIKNVVREFFSFLGDEEATPASEPAPGAEAAAEPAPATEELPEAAPPAEETPEAAPAEETPEAAPAEETPAEETPEAPAAEEPPGAPPAG